MRQDTDVARMAAALRTPALKYRSFGNEPVRNAPSVEAQSDDQAFGILGDALSGASDLPPDMIMGGPASESPLPTETPVLPVQPAAVANTPLPVPPPPAWHAEEPARMPDLIAPNPYAQLQRAPLPEPPPVRPAPVQQETMPVVPSWSQPLPPAPPSQPQPAPSPAAHSLLQVLMGDHAPPAPPVTPQAVPVVPPPVAPLAVSAQATHPQPALPQAPIPVRPEMPAQLPRQAPLAASPQVPAAPASPPPLPLLASLSSGPAALPPIRMGGSTGSSLLDALMGFGPGAGSTTVHYPLLDALGDAMRGTGNEPSPRHWPAERVDIALPDLLRRIAAGVRFARNAA
ncbi:hypothetical protein J8J14_21630 [Roseomonas sp. SSH11]|uniref:Uncharacterized protein n=1 Tax=Pararoseomonas baculiformis TaxID=2820812 RepID=A0ABS4AK24_9PROT|nr:hypothetical protein [Pararoseomonas baculiformis]MBP0447372.1 hypothetical protein [Pararoseomonas baculiformis]